MNRRHDLDALRAFAMLLGIVFHVALAFGEPVGWFFRDSQRSEGWRIFTDASHAFRMPLFFVVSGFFTAMLWVKRGALALLWHRFKRIFLPLLIGLVTIIPLNERAFEWAFTKGTFLEQRQKQKADSAAETEPETDLPKKPGVFSALANAMSGGKLDFRKAIRAGDEAGVIKALEAGVDPNAKDLTMGITPLTLAALHDQPKVAGLLLEAGAEVDGRNRDGSTALTAAAFLGRADVAELLLAFGADPEASDKKGIRARDALLADEPLTRGIANLIDLPFDWDETERGRKKVSSLLRAQGGIQAVMADLLAFAQKDRFHHLWFLWFLCLFVPAFCLLAGIVSVIPRLSIPKLAMVTPLALVWLLPLTVWPQSLMQTDFGPDTSMSILPFGRVIAYYAVFFGFGALYFQAADEEGRLGREWGITLPLALFACLPVAYHYKQAGGPLAEVALAAFTWLMILSLFGIFRRFITSENRVIRSISDASYWLYFAHLPLVVIGQRVVRDWDLPSLLKVLILTVGIVAPLLLIDRLVIRTTPIGWLLNGRKKRPSVEAGEAQKSI